MADCIRSSLNDTDGGLLWLETSNALLTGIRRGRWDGAGADAAVALLDGGG